MKLKLCALYLLVAGLLGIVAFQQFLLGQQREIILQCRLNIQNSIRVNHQCVQSLSVCSVTMAREVPVLKIWMGEKFPDKRVHDVHVNLQAIGGGFDE